MAVGRISGPLLKDNLLRNGVNLAFETSLLYLDVVNSRVGINTTAPSNDLTVNGTTRTTDLLVTNEANIASFTISSNTISSSSNTINLLPSGTNPVVYQGKILVDNNLTIRSNVIETTVSGTDLLINTTGTGQVVINSDARINGNIHATGNITADGDLVIAGNITIGDQTTDTISFVAGIDSNLIPATTNTYDLGTPSLRWANSYFTSANISNLFLSNNTITTTSGDLNLQANSNNSVKIRNLSVNDNIISSVNTNANIVLTPQGTGSVVINSNQSFVVPVGTTVQRPTGQNGMVRYNSDFNRYEGYSNGYWTNLGGVQSVDGLTRITPESTPGAGNNVISFYANNNLTAYIDSSKLYTIDFRTSDIDITGNTISTYTSNTDLNLSTPGTGSVVLGNLRFNGNTITNGSSGAVTQFVATSTGYYKFGGTFGVTIPVGLISNRPALAYAETGMIRFNTDLQAVEVFNGAAWGSIVGTAGGINSTQATDISIATVLTFG